MGPSFPAADALDTGAEVWAAQVAAAAVLPDQRLHTRLAQILTTLAHHPKDPLPQAAASWAQAKGTYRFLANERFAHPCLTAALAQVTVQSCAGATPFYAVHDSSSLNFSSLKSTVGLGRLGDSATASGLMLHSVLAVSPAGVVRGLLALDLWARPVDQRTKEQRYERPFEAKESFKWIRGLRAVRAALAHLPDAQRPRCIHLMDREGDIHEVFADILAHGDGAIIRCAQNRKVAGAGDRAHAAVAASPLRGTTTLTLRTPGRAVRQAQVQLRGGTVRLTPSQRDYPGRQPLTLNLVEVRETAPPPGVEAVHWFLWTTEPIATLDNLLEQVGTYRLRWRIEEYHLTLKSGCHTEDLQLETAERLGKAIVLYAAVAARIVALRDLGHHQPDLPCTVLLSDVECQVLTATFATTPAARAATPTIRQAMQWIGRLGGHLGRRRDGLPGVRTLWRGWRALALLVQGYRLQQRPR